MSLMQLVRIQQQQEVERLKLEHDVVSLSKASG